MKKFFLVALALLSMESFATVFTGCGEYQLRGNLKKESTQKLKLKFMVLENTRSSQQFIFEDQSELSKLLPYLDQFTEIKVFIDKKMDGNNGTITKILAVRLATPDPLRPQEDFQKLASRDCR
jgi:hypothetical protein